MTAAKIRVHRSLPCCHQKVVIVANDRVGDEAPELIVTHRTCTKCGRQFRIEEREREARPPYQCKEALLVRLSFTEIPQG